MQLAEARNRYVADFFQKSRLGTAGSGTKPIEPTIKNVFLDNLNNICKAKINLTVPQTPYAMLARGTHDDFDNISLCGALSTAEQRWEGQKL